MVTDSSDDVNKIKFSSLIGQLKWKGVINHLINAFFCKVVSFAVLKIQSVHINTAFFSHVKMKKKSFYTVGECILEDCKYIILPFDLKAHQDEYKQ